MDPVIVIGAPRSGTKILRDVLARLPGIGTWPCDEINPIWRHGNAGHPTDELEAERATPPVRRFIRRRFLRLAETRGLDRVVEKTCANSLRVPFVDRVLPEARFVFLVRDGRDAAASAMRRWAAPVDWRYTLAKARFVPWTDLPTYGIRFLTNRLHRAISRQQRVKTWGPRFSGIDELLAREGLAVTCATQWARCVAAAREALAGLGPERVVSVRYEELVAEPAAELQRIAAFLTAPVTLEAARERVADVTAVNVGKGRRELDEAALGRITPILRPELERHGYL